MHVWVNAFTDWTQKKVNQLNPGNELNNSNEEKYGIKLNEWTNECMNQKKNNNMCCQSQKNKCASA